MFGLPCNFLNKSREKQGEALIYIRDNGPGIEPKIRESLFLKPIEKPGSEKGLGFGLLAEAIGLHLIVGAYLAGLFFREEVASPELIRKVEDRVYAIAYSFLGPIFFM